MHEGNTPPAPPIRRPHVPRIFHWSSPKWRLGKPLPVTRVQDKAQAPHIVAFEALKVMHRGFKRRNMDNLGDYYKHFYLGVSQPRRILAVSLLARS